MKCFCLVIVRMLNVTVRMRILCEINVRLRMKNIVKIVLLTMTMSRLRNMGNELRVDPQNKVQVVCAGELSS